jgi:hypothetical protein
MIIKRVAYLALTAACLTGIATLPAAHAQTAYGTAPAAALPTGDPGGNSMGLLGPNPGGPGLTPYTGGAPGAAQPYPSYPTAPGAYGATQPAYPAAPSAAGTSNTEVVTNGPQPYPPQPPGWSPERSVLESEHYTWLLEHNRAFRQARERKECGPITDPQLHQNCLASFEEYSPWAGSVPAYGSSTGTRGYSSTSGR